MIPERISSSEKPLKGTILEADVLQWPSKTNKEKFVVCVTGYKNRVSFSNTIRTSWVEKTYEKDGKRFAETRNSIYEIKMSDINFKVLNDLLKHEHLDVERMKL